MANIKILETLWNALKKLSCFPSAQKSAKQNAAQPEDASPETKGAYELEIREYFDNRQKSLKILATTETPMGQTIDWIPRESQGTLASPPPSSNLKPGDKVTYATPELEMSGAVKGPEGAVPVLRKNLDGMKFDQPLEVILNKVRGSRLGAKQDNTLSAQAGPGTHRYGSSQQAVTNYGGSGNLSYWNPPVQTNGDFSLLQTGVINTQQIEQTAEAGWQVFPALNGDAGSRLFTCKRFARISLSPTAWLTVC